MSDPTQALTLLWTSESGQAYSVQVDSARDITISRDNEVTKKAVEKGAKITDHVREGTTGLSFSWSVSNTPMRRMTLPSGDIVGNVLNVIGFDPQYYSPPLAFSPGGLTRAVEGLLGGAFLPRSATVLQFDEFDYLQQVRAILLTAKNEGSLFQVFMPSGELQDLVITKLDDTPGGLQWTTLKIDMEHIRIVESKIVAAPKPTVPRANPNANGGAQGTKEQQEAAKRASLLSKFTGDGIIPG